MIVRALAAAIAALALASPAAAHAQSLFVVSFGLGKGEHLVSQTNFSVQASGEMRITFHGDPATGCAARGLCRYAGAETWRPSSDAGLVIAKIRRGRSIQYAGAVDFSGGEGGGLTTIVRRLRPGQAPGTCADIASTDDFSELTGHGGALTIAVMPSVTTRCAGPLASDLAGALPRVTVSARALLAGRSHLDFRGSRSFAAHGLAGTIASTVQVTAVPTKGSSGGPGPPPPATRHRQRFVTEHLNVAAVSGRVRAHVRGGTDATVCALLDSCGALGELSWSPVPARASGELFAVGPARLPYRDYLVALGLRRGQRRAAIQVGGQVGWEERGAVQETLALGDNCSDTAALTNGYVGLALAGRELKANYETAVAPRTRCPGPELNPLGVGYAAGSVGVNPPMRRFTIHLHAGGFISEDGYTSQLSGGLSLTLRRGRITQQIFSEQYGTIRHQVRVP